MKDRDEALIKPDLQHTSIGRQQIARLAAIHATSSGSPIPWCVGLSVRYLGPELEDFVATPHKRIVTMRVHRHCRLRTPSPLATERQPVLDCGFGTTSRGRLSLDVFARFASAAALSPGVTKRA